MNTKGPVLIKDSPANGASVGPVLRLEPVDLVGLWGASQPDSVQKGAVDTIENFGL